MVVERTTFHMDITRIQSVLHDVSEMLEDVRHTWCVADAPHIQGPHTQNFYLSTIETAMHGCMGIVSVLDGTKKLTMTEQKKPWELEGS